jgi:hypothetical protein
MMGPVTELRQLAARETAAHTRTDDASAPA